MSYTADHFISKCCHNHLSKAQYLFLPPTSKSSESFPPDNTTNCRFPHTWKISNEVVLAAFSLPDSSVSCLYILLSSQTKLMIFPAGRLLNCFKPLPKTQLSIHVYPCSLNLWSSPPLHVRIPQEIQRFDLIWIRPGLGIGALELPRWHLVEIQWVHLMLVPKSVSDSSRRTGALLEMQSHCCHLLQVSFCLVI